MASTPSNKKLLLLGANGYIGGTILHRLLSSSDDVLGNYRHPISLLIRGEERARKLTERYGERITCILFSGLDDLDTVTQVAAQHDIIINTSSGFHPQSAEAMVRELAKRKQETGNETWMIHTSGCTNISDKPLTGEAFPDREWFDSDSAAVFAFEEEENEKEAYPPRTAELLALKTAEALGVRGVSVQAAGIFGQGEGLFPAAAIIIPTMLRYAVEKGYGYVLGPGTSTFDIVHVSDLADFYLVLLRHILGSNPSAVPTGKRGILFPENGRMTMKDMMKDCLDVAFKVGLLPIPSVPQRPEIREISLEEATAFTGGSRLVAERGWAGHRNTRGVVGRELGWKPSKGRADWLQDIEVEAAALREGKRGISVGSWITPDEKKE